MPKREGGTTLDEIVTVMLAEAHHTSHDECRRRPCEEAWPGYKQRKHWHPADVFHQALNRIDGRLIQPLASMPATFHSSTNSTEINEAAVRNLCKCVVRQIILETQQGTLSNALHILIRSRKTKIGFEQGRPAMPHHALGRAG